MKVAQFSLPLLAIVVIGLNQSALAGPQSLLDPYATIKAPVRKAAPRTAAPARDIPTSVTVGEGPAQVQSNVPASTKVAGPKGGGMLAGTRNIFGGIAAATKGAGAGIASGTKKVGSSVAGGAKSSGGFIAKGASSVGDGVKSVGGKVKGGGGSLGEKMAVVPKKVGEGLKATGGKIKDGSLAVGHAIAAAPKKIGIGKDDKVAASARPSGERVADASANSAAKISNEKDSVGEKLVAMPKAIGKGIVGAAAKTGEGARKVATAPVGFFGKLNPFKHKDAPVQTAAKEKETPIK